MNLALAYIPFVSPLPIADYWAWLLIPLTVAVSVVYKCTKTEHVRDIPAHAGVLSLWILGAMIAAGAALVGIVELTTRH